MLKIKDNVDLKELEKFGFKYKPNTKMWHEGYLYEDKTDDNVYPCMRCFIFYSDRHIITNSIHIDILYDLIQAGLVEKVGGKDE